MRFPRKRGASSNMVRVFVPDNTSTTGAGCTGLSSGSTNLVIAFSREFQNGSTTYTGANIEDVTTIGTYEAPSSSSKCRFKAVDATNQKGLYEIHFHNNATVFGSADAAKNVIINILETTTTALKIGPNMVMIPLSVRNVLDGESDIVAFLGSAITETAGQIAAAFTKFFNKATPTGTVNSLPDTVPGQTNGLALVGSAMTLASSALQAIWDVGTAVLGAAGSIGKLILDNLNATVGSRSSHSAADVKTAMETDGSKLDTIYDRVPDTLSLANINAEVDTALNTAIPGSPAANSINERIAALDDLTQASGAGDLVAIKTTIGAAGAGLTAVQLTSAYDAAKTAAAAGAKMDLVDAPNATAVTAIQSGLATATLIAALDTILDKLDTMLEADGAVSRFTANALENSPVGSGGFTSGDRTTIENALKFVKALL
jgi:hypothetical protein